MNARVLVVEDDADVRDFYDEALRDSYDVSLAEDGIRGLEQIDKAQFDVVLLDMMMPRMSGPEFASELRRRGIRIPIILCSAMPGVEVEAGRIGAGHYCQKPCALARLLELVGIALKSQGPDEEVH